MKQVEINSLIVDIIRTLICISYCTAFCCNGSPVSFVNLSSGIFRSDNLLLYSNRTSKCLN